MQTMQILKFVKKDIPRWAAGTVPTPVGPVPRITSDWSRADLWGMIRSRVSAFRMSYSVTPGLYAIGDPTKESDVFVTANYKLTFDILRRELQGFDAWVLVLDTKSINVWCAAGKGTFGTDELVNRISGVKLDTVVSHRRLILPQLSAVGVNAAEVKKKTGFRVSFGPVEARDIPAYIRAGYIKTAEMNMVRFPLLDRLILTPMEINPAMKKFPVVAAVFLVIFGLQPSGLLFHQAWTGGLPFLLLTLIAVLAGALVTPVLLPYIPFRSFAAKGWIVGALTTLLALRVSDLMDPHDGFLRAAAYVLFPALSSYLALQFTGATTFTSMSGVKKEMKFGVPLYIGATAFSLILVFIYKMKEWRLV